MSGGCSLKARALGFKVEDMTKHIQREKVLDIKFQHCSSKKLLSVSSSGHFSYISIDYSDIVSGKELT